MNSMRSRLVHSPPPRHAEWWLRYALALGFAAAGGSKLPSLRKVVDAAAGAWYDSWQWNALLLLAAVAEVIVALLLAASLGVRGLLRGCRPVLAGYLALLMVGEFVFPGFARKCGCFGPLMSPSTGLHIAITGALLGGTTLCLRFHPLHGTRAGSPTAAPMP